MSRAADGQDGNGLHLENIWPNLSRLLLVSLIMDKKFSKVYDQLGDKFA